MAKNTFHRLPAAALNAMGVNMETVIGLDVPNPYGATDAQLTALAGGNTALAAAIQAQTDAEAAYHASVQARQGAQQDLVNAIASIADTAYGTADVTNEMIAAIGLQPRDTTRTKIIPTTPTLLTATPAIDGSVALAWNRNGNQQGVNFRIEARSATGAWTFVTDTTGSKVKLTGYTPGVTFSFRVCASKNGIVTTYSNEAQIYPAGASPQLSLAA